jgi:hypothetical protein
MRFAQKEWHMKNKKRMVALIAAVLTAIAMYAKLQGEPIDQTTLDAVGAVAQAAVEEIQVDMDSEKQTVDGDGAFVLPAEGAAAKMKR